MLLAQILSGEEVEGRGRDVVKDYVGTHDIQHKVRAFMLNTPTMLAYRGILAIKHPVIVRVKDIEDLLVVGAHSYDKRSG